MMGNDSAISESSSDSSPLPIPIGRLRWLCRRGMKEFDILFESYLDQHYQTADQLTQQAFIDLLNTPDPVIMDYITGKAIPDSVPQTDILRLMQQR